MICWKAKGETVYNLHEFTHDGGINYTEEITPIQEDWQT